jgi:putative phage-type endonuclease
MARVERIHQHTPEWHAWRMQGLGSSDAPAVMRESPWRTPKQLWELRTGRRTELDDTSPALRRGRKLEPEARAAYEAFTSEQMEPLCLVHDRLEWMRASVDGIGFDRAIVLEIKCPLRSEDHRLAAEGQVPRHYFAQLQHQLEVTQANELHYWSFDGERGALVRVKPDPDYIERLIEVEAEFWRRVVENRWPELGENELDLSDRTEWRTAALRYREVKLRLEQATGEERQARAQLEAMATARRTYGGGIEVLRSFRKGAVNYASVPQLRGVDLEPYRKPLVEVVKINLHGQP